MAQVDAFNHSFDDVDDLLALIRPEPDHKLDALIGFLDARMANLGWSLDDLAARMSVDPSWLAALLAGRIPAGQIDDEMLERIACAIDYEANLLRILLGRKVEPTIEDDSAAGDDDTDDIEARLEEYWREIETVLDDITDYLLNRVEEHYTSAVNEEGRTHRQQDFVIKQIEMIIAKHREDIQTVEILVEELKHTVEGDGLLDAGVHRLDIRRIIHHIRESA